MPYSPYIKNIIIWATIKTTTPHRYKETSFRWIVVCSLSFSLLLWSFNEIKLTFSKGIIETKGKYFENIKYCLFNILSCCQSISWRYFISIQSRMKLFIISVLLLFVQLHGVKELFISYSAEREAAELFKYFHSAKN